MLPFLNQLRSFQRTPNSSQNPLILDGGRASLEFFRSGSTPSFMRATMPKRLTSEMPVKTDTDHQSLEYPQQKSSTLVPPLHWHSKQDETFIVVSGRMLATVSGQQRIAGVSEEVFIQRCHYHTFSNASSDSDLVVDVKLNPDNRLRDERFFRNAYGYLDDITKAGESPSPFQALLFLWSADVIPALPGPKFIMAPLSTLIAWFGGIVIGKWVLGYQEAYPEYTPKELQDVKKDN